MVVINMVEIIAESNPDLNKNLFLKELSKIPDGVTVKITRISDAIASNRNKKEDFIYIDFLIVDEFKAPLTLDKTGAIIPDVIDATGDIIAIPFTLNEVDENGNYTINRGKNLFNILNYGMKQQKMIPVNNNSSIRCNYDEITTALADLSFTATANLVNSKDFNDYYRLEVKENSVKHND